MLKFNLKKLSAVLGFFSVFALMACSEDNPIEIENDRFNDGFGFEAKNLEAELVNADLKICIEKYGETRCKNFKEKYGSYDCDEIKDPSYGDDGELIVESSSSAGEPYLLKNMQLKITLKSYRQVPKVFAEDDPEGDPEVRFAVKFFSDGVQVRMAVTEEYIVSPVLLQEKNLIEWSGNKSSTMEITRGIDEVQLCPMVKDLDEDEDSESPKDVDISSGECFSVKEIGFLDAPVEQKDFNKKYEISWTIELY